MIKILKLILKLTPFLAGAAIVSQQLEEKGRRRFSVKRVLLLLGLLLGVMFGASAWSVWSSADDQYVGEGLNGCAVVFGAAVWRDDQPSHALDDRVQAGIDLYKQGVDCLVLSGGASKFGAHEVEVMQKIALGRGVKPQDIELDYYGNNTLATMLNLDPTRRYVFVSNDFHLGRIGLMARRLDISEFYLNAAEYQHGRYTKNTEYFVREVFGTLLVWFGL